MSIILTVLIVLSAGLHLKAQYLGPQLQVYIFNPLTMILMIAWVVLVPGVEKNPKYTRAIIAGFVFSLVGDILLILPQDLFILGLVSFLVAQIIYTYAFLIDRRVRLNSLSILPFGIFGVLIFIYLAPGLGELTIPVLAYMVVILMMGWQAWDQWDTFRERWAQLAFIGAVFFILSDTFLAIDKFRTPIDAAPALTLISYVVAQYLIALSTRRDSPL
jgi:uncharacterized membrane protein YhhN